MQINSHDTKIFTTEDLDNDLDRTIREMDPDSVFLIIDNNTEKYCFPLIPKLKTNKKVHLIKTGEGEKNKNLENINKIWNELTIKYATRNSLVINLGGGLLSDIGGFAASTFKRGIRFINIPTTLLSMVDASVGGKTGFNYNTYKNLIGVFNSPAFVFIYAPFLETLPKRHLYAGWAEMIKHGLIYSGRHLSNLLETNPEEAERGSLNELIFNSISIKNHFVLEDPHEQNIRKALNFGHTLGHAFESLSQRMDNPLLHGEAIANGMICELYLSVQKTGFKQNELERIREYIREYYPIYRPDVNMQESLLSIARQDKKNRDEKINFTLLKDTGLYQLDVYIEEQLIRESFEYLISID
jgi:3-dehydroquinate synthase